MFDAEDAVRCLVPLERDVVDILVAAAEPALDEGFATLAGIMRLSLLVAYVDGLCIRYLTERAFKVFTNTGP